MPDYSQTIIRFLNCCFFARNTPRLDGVVTAAGVERPFRERTPKLATTERFVTEADLDPRYEDGYILADSDLMTFEEWWREFNANVCCARPSDYCGCGGYTDRLPSGASRLLRREEDDA